MGTTVGHLGLFAPLPPELASQFPKLSQDSSPCHVTVVYLGDTPVEDVPGVLDVLRAVVGRFKGPVRADLAGLDYFYNPEEGTSVAHVRVSFSKSISELRDQCLTALEDAGYSYPQRFSRYFPHVTLAYQDGLRDVFEGHVPSGSWTLDEVELWGVEEPVPLSFGVRVASKFKEKKKIKNQKGEEATVYLYSDKQVQHRNREKATRVERLRKMRGDLVKQVKKDYGSKDVKTRLSALAVGLIDLTYERVGNDASAKDGHFGVTGWQVKHVSFSGSKATISYVGKSGVDQKKTVKDSKAVSLLKELVKGKKPGDKVLSMDGVTLGASDVNSYLPEGITAKDLRGLHANEEMRQALKRVRKGTLPSDPKEREAKLKKEFAQALEEVAGKVGHEASTLRKQYLVPGLEDTFMQKGKVMSTLKKARFTIPGVRVAFEEIPGVAVPRTALEAVWFEDSDGGHISFDSADVDAFESLKDKYSFRSRQLEVRDSHFQPGQGSPVAEFSSTVPSDVVDAMVRSGSWSSGDAATVLAQSCSRCLNVISHHYKQGGYAFGSSEYWECNTRCAFCEHVSRRATKSVSQKEDEGSRDMLRKEPKKKPPRQDLRRNRTYDEDVDNDDDLKGRGAEGDKDLSRNFKRIGTDKARSEEAAQKQFEEYQKENPETDKTWKDFLDKKKDQPKGGPGEGGDQGPANGQLVPGQSKKPKKKPKPKANPTQVSEAISSLSDSVGMELDAEIQSALQGALSDLSADAGGKLVQEIASALEGASSEYSKMDRESIEDAKAELDGLSESLEGVSNPEIVLEQISHALQAQKVLADAEAMADPKKAKERLQKNLQNAFGVESISDSVGAKLESLAGMSPDDQKEFLVEVKKAQMELADALEKNNEGDTHYPPGFLDKATEAMNSDSFADGASIKDKARNIALSIVAESAISNPLSLGGKEVSSDTKSEEELAARGKEAFEKYKDLSPALRQDAAKTIAEQLKETNEDDPKHAELNRILDGIALASVVNLGDDEELPKIEGRPMTPAFARMAQQIAKQGNASVLLGSVEDYVSNRGQRAVQRALEGLDDDVLSQVAKEQMPEVSAVLEGKGLETGKRAVVRQALIDAQIDSMSLVDQLVASRAKAAGAKDWDDAKVRARIAKSARALNPKKAMGKFLEWAKEGSKGPSDAAFLRAGGHAVPPEVAMRMEELKAVDEYLQKEYGTSDSHHDQILARFFETKDPGFLRADPDPNQKTTHEARFSLDTGSVITAGSSESCNWTSVSFRGPNMTTFTKEAATELETISETLDKVASYFQDNHETLGIESKIAKDFAYRCDLLADECDKVLKSAAVTGTGKGQSVGSDDNMTMTTDGYDASQIAEQKSGPVRADGDEPYMREHFLQKEFNELRNFQEKGMLDNVKSAAAVFQNITDRLNLLAAADAE